MGVDPPPRPDERPVRLSRSSWITLMVAIVVAVAAIVLFPSSDVDTPPLASLALIGTIVTGIMTAALYAIVRRDLAVPRRLAISFAVAFVLIGVVKFVLAPFGLYEVNAVTALDEFVGTVGDVRGATLTAAMVFALYALVYRSIYRFIRHGSRDEPPISGRSVVTALVILGLLAVSGIGFVAVIFLTAPRQYLEFVFSSGAGVLVAVALVVAATLLGSVFRALERRPDLVVDLGAVVTLFGLGLGLLALYHVLWIVYVLVLASIWPLRTVVPK